MCGLTALQMAPESELREPQRLYNVPGLTFTAAELFREISAHVPGFRHHQKINANMDKFAKLWPDTVSPDERTLRDLNYEPEVTLPRMVAAVLNAHSGRRTTSRASCRSIDTSTRAPSPAQPSPAQPSPARPNPAQQSPAQASPAQPRLAQPN